MITTARRATTMTGSQQWWKDTARATMMEMNNSRATVVSRQLSVKLSDRFSVESASSSQILKKVQDIERTHDFFLTRDRDEQDKQLTDSNRNVHSRWYTKRIFRILDINHIHGQKRQEKDLKHKDPQSHVERELASVPRFVPVPIHGYGKEAVRVIGQQISFSLGFRVNLKGRAANHECSSGVAALEESHAEN